MKPHRFHSDRRLKFMVDRSSCIEASRLICLAFPMTVLWWVTKAKPSTHCDCGRRPLRPHSISANSAVATFLERFPDKTLAESLTRVLYPDDSTPQGRSLRFLKKSTSSSAARWSTSWPVSVDAVTPGPSFPDKVAIQLNDTHPAMAVAELMRILLDEADLSWDEAWDLTVGTLAYTNHTLLPEALEKWPVHLFEGACCHDSWKLFTKLIDVFSVTSNRSIRGTTHNWGRVSLDRGGLGSQGPDGEFGHCWNPQHKWGGGDSLRCYRTKTVPDFAELSGSVQ